MLRVEGQTVKVARVEVRDVGKGEDGTRFEARINLEHDPESEKVLPECRAAVKSILREQAGRTDDDKRNDVITIKLKRDLPRCRYVLGIFGGPVEDTPELVATESRKGASVSEPAPTTTVDFLASVKNQPSVQAVHGVLRVKWCVEAMLSRDQLADLCLMIGSDMVAGTITPAQAELDFDARQGAAAAE